MAVFDFNQAKKEEVKAEKQPEEERVERDSLSSLDAIQQYFLY